MTARTEQQTQRTVRDEDPVPKDHDDGKPSQYAEVREDIRELLSNMETFFQAGRRPHYLSEESHERLVAAFDALLDETLDEDDELGDVDLDDTLEKVRVLRAFAGL